MSLPRASSLCVFSRHGLRACRFDFSAILQPSASILAPPNPINRWRVCFFRNSLPFRLWLFFRIPPVFAPTIYLLPLLPFFVLSFFCYFNTFSAIEMPRTHHINLVRGFLTPSRCPWRSPGGEDMTVEEGDNFPTVEELLPRHPMSRRDFLKDPPPTPAPVLSETEQVHIDALRAKYNIPAHIEMVPVGRDFVEVHRPVYCAFYEYPFVIGHSFPLLPLAEEFCRFYQVYLTQLSPYMLKILLLLTKYA